MRRYWTKIALIWVAWTSLLCAGPAQADVTGPAQAGVTGDVMRVETRGVSLPLYAVWNDGAQATLVLYSGGSGGYGAIGADGWPASKNFLIRSAQLFAAQPFNVVLVGLAPDLSDLDGRARISERHAADNLAIFRAIKAKSAAPIWLVGTSMGTISATAAAIRDAATGDIAGLVLTSSITAYRVAGAVPSQQLDQIRVPVLVVHHQHDACRNCTPYEAKNIADKLTRAPFRKTVLVDGGAAPSGDPCGPLHYHGYIGMEQRVVDLIAAWIRHPEN